MKRTMCLICACAVAVLAAAPGFGLDVTTSLDVSDRAYFRYWNDAAAGRIATGVSAAETVAEGFSLSLTAWNAVSVAFDGGVTLIPEEADLAATAAWYGSILSVGVTATAFAAESAVYEMGAFLDVTPALPLEMASLLLELFVSSDFHGVYAELKAAPSITLPLSVPVAFSLDATLEGLAAGFRGTTVNGLAGLSLTPAARLFLPDGVTVALRGGYFFSFNDAFASYPYIQLGVVIPSVVPKDAEETPTQ